MTARSLALSKARRPWRGTGSALEGYREWCAAGRPGSVSHDQARRLLLGNGQ